MGKLLSLFRTVAREKQLSGPLGKFLEKLATQVDEGVASAVAGAGLFASGDTLNVGENADGSIVVNGDNIQVSALLQAAAAAGAAAAPIVTGSGISSVGGLSYLTQATWYVNATTGSDTNDGSTSVTALQTLRELARRFEGRVVPQNTTINLVGVFAEPFILQCVAPPTVLISVVGEVPTATATGSITAAFVQFAPATNTDAKLTDATQTWAPLIRKRIQMTSGANNGAIAWLMKDLGANVVRVSQFTNRANGNMVTPANGDTYKVETLLTAVSGIQVRIGGGGNIKYKDLIDNASLNSSGEQSFVTGVPGFAATRSVFDGCAFVDSHHFSFSRINTMACKFSDGTNAEFRTTFSVHFTWGMAAFGTITSQDQVTGGLIVCGTSILQNAGLGVYGAVTLLFDSTFTAASLGVFDKTAQQCVEVDNGGILAPAVANAYLFGSGNTCGNTVVVRAGPNCIQYVTKPVITGTGNDALVGGVIRLWTQIPYFNGYDGVTVGTGNGAMIVARV